MTDSLYIAFRYLGFYRARTYILLTVIALIAFIPAALSILTHEAERQLTARAKTTSLLIGAKGSTLDLTMSSLYFRASLGATFAFGEAGKIDATGLAYAVPLYVRFHARGMPIVGTSIDYFDYRGLRLARGRIFGLLGESVIGSDVARQFGIGLGGSVISSPENPFDLAGGYPLKMAVVGILAPTGTPDDRAIFVDVRTAWVIDGLGHGHDDLAKVRDASVILKRDQGNVVANAKLMQHGEINAANVDDFHFHGDAAQFPITAAIVVADNAKAEAILRGRYEASTAMVQAVKPGAVMGGVIDDIFQIKRLIDGVIALVGLATLLALILVFSLSLRLRERELEILFLLGARRLTTARLIGAEVFMLLLTGLTLAALAAALLGLWRKPIVFWLSLI